MKRLPARSSYVRRLRKRRGRRMLVESLEARMLLTTWTVNSLEDGPIVADEKLTLREAVAAARLNVPQGDAIAGSSDDVIRFAESLFTGGPQNILLDSGKGPLNVQARNTTNDIKIIGPGSVGSGDDRQWLLSVDGQNATGVFTVGGTVTISGIEITGSNTTAIAITNTADLTVEDVNLNNSTGGAIRIPGGSLAVSNSVLRNNTTSGRGGAIEIDGINATATVTDSIIVGNHADVDGGGISNRAGRLVVLRSTVSHNSADGNGGGLVAFVEAKTSIHESTLEGNSAGANGGAIRNRESQLTIGDSVLHSNTADTAGGGISFVLDTQAELKIRSTTISNNTALIGAGIDNQGGLLDVSGSTLSGNVSRTSGGGIASRGAAPDTLVVNSTISGNRAIDSGGGIWQETGKLLLTNATIAMNRSDADGDSVGNGGGLSLNNDDSQSVELVNTLVAGNVNGQSPAVTVDNGDIGFTVNSGTWPASTGSGFGTGFVSNAAVDGSGAVSWTFDGLETGRYRVLSTWKNSETAATNAPFALKDGAKTRQTVLVNQQKTPRSDAVDGTSDFQELGTVTVGSGELVVVLSNNANGTVIADAVRIERVDDDSTLSDVHVINGGSILGSGLWNLIGDPDSSGGLINDIPGQSFDFNLVGNADENGQLHPWDIDRILFTELADNLGGPTAVHALKVDSPAIDAGSFFRPGGSRSPFSDAFADPPKPLTSDQRGLPYLRANKLPLVLESPVANQHPDEAKFYPVDIGAFEVQQRPLFTAQELVVSTLEDESDGDFSRGDFSLREAVEIANLSSDHNSIRFADSLISDTGANSAIALSSALQIDWDLTLSGPGSNLLSISGSNSTRILEISPLASVEISGLTFEHGLGTLDRGREFDVFTVDVAGGAMFNAGHASLIDVVFEDNVDDTESDFFNVAGGGAINNKGTMTIRDSRLGNNRSNHEGGAIRNFGGRMEIGPDVLIWRNSAVQGGGIHTAGDLTLFDSRVESNSAEEGGGISATNTATVEIRRSLIESNSVDITDPDGTGVGGGIASYGSLLISDTTIADNDIGTNRIPGDSTAKGGGIFVSGFFSRNSVVVIERTTLWSNEIFGGLSSHGGGLHVADGAGGAEFRVVNTTISGNKADSRQEGLGGGVFVTGSGNTVPHFFDTTIAFNEASKTDLDNHQSDGAGIFADDLINLSNVIVSNNEVKSSGTVVAGGEIFIHSDGSYPNLSNQGEVRVHRPVLVLGGAVSGGSLKNANGSANVLPRTGDPQLGPLELRNGGFTATHKLNGAFNDAIDAGERLGLLDQRGYPVTDILDIVDTGGVADLGAYESSDQVRIESFSADVRNASQFGSSDAFVAGVGFDDGRGDESLIPKEPAFLGLKFDPDPFRLGPGIADGTGLGDLWGAEVIADVDGRIGIDYGYYVNSGSVDTFYNGLFGYSIDDSADNGTVTINTGATFTDGEFYTISPRVSAYADLVFELNASLSGEACVVACASFAFPINIGASTQLFSINRQVVDANGDAVFGPNGELLFDGDIQFGNAPIQKLAGIAADKTVEKVVDEASQARQNRRTAEIELKSGKNRDGSPLTDADRTAKNETIKNSIKREKDLVSKTQSLIRGCVGEIVTACVSEAEGSLLGAEVEFGLGLTAGPVSLTQELGSASVTLPDIQLSDDSFDNDHGKLSATTDDFTFGSEQDYKRQLAKLQIDAAALIGARFGYPLGTFNASLGPVSVEATTISYNVGPQFSITQDVEVEPFFDENHRAKFTFQGGFTGIVKVTVGEETKDVSNGQFVEFIPGQNVKIENPDGKNIDIIPSMKVGNRFSNDIGIDFDVIGLLEVLKLQLNAFGEEIFNVGPLYENEHSVLEALGIGAVNLGSVFDETFNLPAKEFTLKDAKDRDGDQITDEDLVIKIGPGADLPTPPQDGTTPGAAIPLESGTEYTYAPAEPQDPNATVYFSLPLIDENGIIGTDVSSTSGQLISFIRPPYGGMTLELTDLSGIVSSFDLDVEGQAIGSSVASWRLKGFENLLGSQAIFGVQFRSDPQKKILAIVDNPNELSEVSFTYDDTNADPSKFLGNNPDRRVTAESQREVEQQTNAFVLDNDLAFDIDNNGVVSVTTDGVLVARYMDGMTGNDLIEGAIADDSRRRDDTISQAEEIVAYLDNLKILGRLDVDDSDENGQYDPLVDGTLILRHLAGIGLSTTSGPALTDGITFPASAQRRGPQEIAEFINGRRGPRVNQDFADELLHRSHRSVSGAADAMLVSDDAIVGSSPWTPVMSSFIGGSGTFNLSTYGQSTQYEDLFLTRINDESQRDLIRTGPKGTPGRLADTPDELTDFVTDPTASAIADLADRMVVENRSQILGVEEPIFLQLPYQRSGIGGYLISVPVGLSLSKLIFDPAVGGNAFLDQTLQQNETDIDFDVFIPATNETMSFSMDDGLIFTDTGGSLREDVREIRLVPRGLSDATLFGEDKQSEPDLDITLGLVLAGPVSPVPQISVGVLDEGLAPSTFARAMTTPAVIDSQVVMITDHDTVEPNGIFSVEVEYHITGDNAGIPPAVLLEIHYDSSRVKFNGISNLLESGLVNSFTANSPEDIESVSDGDIRTDSVIVLSWSDFFGAWPADATSATRLATISFQAEDVVGMTDIHLTGDSSADYQFDISSVDIDVKPRILVVDTQSDVSDGNFGPGNFSLREAIEIANLRSTPSLIQFDTGIETINLAGGQMTISNDITIEGPGQSQLTIDAMNGSRIFDIESTAVDVTLIGLTLTGGNTLAGESGGAIRSSASGTLTIDRSTISGNTAGKDGGGIFSQGGLVVTESTFSGNSASNGGGAITQRETTAKAEIVSSTIHGNSAVFGGGIMTLNSSTSVLNSTISGNTSSSLGGGIVNVSSGAGGVAHTTVLQSTIALNSSGAGGAVHSGTQSGATFAEVEIGNSLIVQQASGNNVTRFDQTGSSGAIITSLGHNLADGEVSSLDATGDQDDITGPVVESNLADNGGPTQTLALISGSAAIDAGDSSLVPIKTSSDQRGRARITGSAVDVGAYEFSPTPTVIVTPPSVAQIDESGTSVEVGIVLNARPATSVTIDITSSDPGESEPRFSSIVFGPDNWDTLQTIPVDGVPDFVVDGDQQSTITISVNKSSDSVYASVPDQQLVLTTTDIDVASFDFGDAADPAYPTLLANDGARHSVGALRLGMQIDTESDGQPSASADGDGIDDDGVVFIASMLSANLATTSSVTLTASAAGQIDAWIDFNQDGDWLDSGEKIIDNRAVVTGTNILKFSVPSGAASGDTVARFRLSSAGNLMPTGLAADGEVEDYAVTILGGGASTPVRVDVPTDVVSLSAASGNLVVENNQAELLIVPQSSIGKLDIHGAGSNDFFTIDLSGGDAIPSVGLDLDGNGGMNSLKVTGAASNFDLTSNGTIDVRNFAEIDLTDPAPNVVKVNAAVINALSPTAGTIMVVGGQADAIIFDDAENWRMGETSIVNGRFIRRVDNIAGGNEYVSVDLPSGWHNEVNASDVNNSGDVSVADALRIINELVRKTYFDPSTGILDDPSTIVSWPHAYFDQNGDGKATAIDALRVINELARGSVENGEREQPLIDLAIRQSFGSSDDDGDFNERQDLHSGRTSTINHRDVSKSFHSANQWQPDANASSLDSVERKMELHQSNIDSLLSDADLNDSGANLFW